MEAKFDKQQGGKTLENRLIPCKSSIRNSQGPVTAGKKHRTRRTHLNCCDERQLASKTKIS